MFKKNDPLFYIDIIEGHVIKGKFVDYDGDDMWIKLPGESINTFIYSDTISQRIFERQDKANIALEELKKAILQRLQDKNVLIEELFRKLKKHEGTLYADIVRTTLEDKIT